jgi:hypothetical protein
VIIVIGRYGISCYLLLRQFVTTPKPSLRSPQLEVHGMKNCRWADCLAGEVD